MKNILTVIALIFGIAVVAGTTVSCAKNKVQVTKKNMQNEIDREGSNIKENKYAKKSRRTLAVVRSCYNEEDNR